MSLFWDAAALVGVVAGLGAISPFAYRQVRRASRRDSLLRSFPRMLPPWLLMIGAMSLAAYGDMNGRPVLSAAGIVGFLGLSAWFGGLCIPAVIGFWFGPGDDEPRRRPRSG